MILTGELLSKSLTTLTFGNGSACNYVIDCDSQSFMQCFFAIAQ